MKWALSGDCFHDTDNKKDFSDRLTLLLGMLVVKLVITACLTDVNYYDKMEYLDKISMLSLKTPERKLYYQVMGLVDRSRRDCLLSIKFDIIGFWDSAQEYLRSCSYQRFKIKIKASDKYVVLSILSWRGWDDLF